MDRLLAYIRLARTENIGPVTFQRLMSDYGDPETALAALPELSKRSGRKRPLKAFSTAKAKAEYAATQNLGGSYVVWGEDDYPPQPHNSRIDFGRDCGGSGVTLRFADYRTPRR